MSGSSTPSETHGVSRLPDPSPRCQLLQQELQHQRLQRQRRSIGLRNLLVSAPCIAASTHRRPIAGGVAGGGGRDAVRRGVCFDAGNADVEQAAADRVRRRITAGRRRERAALRRVTRRSGSFAEAARTLSTERALVELWCLNYCCPVASAVLPWTREASDATRTPHTASATRMVGRSSPARAPAPRAHDTAADGFDSPEVGRGHVSDEGGPNCLEGLPTNAHHQRAPIYTLLHFQIC